MSVKVVDIYLHFAGWIIINYLNLLLHKRMRTSLKFKTKEKNRYRDIYLYGCEIQLKLYPRGIFHIENDRVPIVPFRGSRRAFCSASKRPQRDLLEYWAEKNMTRDNVLGENDFKPRPQKTRSWYLLGVPI